jgi:FixJ family two-component response regulator
LTDKQRQVFDKVMECGGNVSKAARDLKLNPKTVRQHYLAAMEKLGRLATKPKAPKMQTLPGGARNLSRADDKRLR